MRVLWGLGRKKRRRSKRPNRQHQGRTKWICIRGVRETLARVLFHVEISKIKRNADEMMTYLENLREIM